MMFKFKQGETVRDLVTGFVGIITERVDYISGYNRYFVQPGIGDDGKHIPGMYFDEPSLERLNVLRLTLDRPEGAPPG